MIFDGIEVFDQNKIGNDYKRFTEIGPKLASSVPQSTCFEEFSKIQKNFQKFVTAPEKDFGENILQDEEFEFLLTNCRPISLLPCFFHAN